MVKRNFYEHSVLKLMNFELLPTCVGQSYVNRIRETATGQERSERTPAPTQWKSDLVGSHLCTSEGQETIACPSRKVPSFWQ